MYCSKRGNPPFYMAWYVPFAVSYLPSIILEETICMLQEVRQLTELIL